MNGLVCLRAGARVLLFFLMATAVGCSSSGFDNSGGRGGFGPVGGMGGTGGAGAGGTGGTVSSLSLSLKASTTQLDPGDVTELTWTVANATACEASGGWSGDKSAGSDAQRVPVFRDTTYTLTCADSAGDEVSSSVTVIVSGRLMATVEVSPNPAQGGERGLATVVVSNPSDAPVDDVEVKIDIPDYVDPLGPEDYSAGGTCSDPVSCGPGDSITWFIGTLQVGEVVTLLIFPTIAVDIPPGTTLSFDLVVTALEEPPVEKSATTQERVRSLALSLEQSASKARPGDQVDYAIHYSNPTDQPLQNVVVILLLPPGTELIGASSGGAPMADGTVQWTFTELAPGQGGTVTSTVESDPALPKGAQLTAKAEGGSDGERTLATTHTALSDGSLVASTQVSPEQVEPGERMMASVTTSNRSLATLEAVEVSVLMPEGIDAVRDSDLSEGGTCPGGVCTAGELATWAIGDLGAGESVTVSFVPVAASTLQDGAFLTFETFVSVGGELALQTSATAIETDRTLELRLRESDNPVRPGQSLFYTLHIANQDSATANGLVALRVPSGTTFVGASEDGALNSDGVVQWPLTELVPGAGTTREIEVQVDPTLPLGSQLRADATATITGSSGEARASRHTPVSATALKASIDVAPDPITPGQAGLVSVLVSNPTTEPVNDVVVDVRIPQHLDAVRDPQLSSGGACPGAVCTEGDRASWSVGTLGAGESTTVSLPPVVASATADGTLISFAAEVNATNEVPVLSSATTLVDGQTPLSLVIEDGAYPVAPGATLVYVVHYANQSTAALNGTLILTIPAGTTFESASDGGALNVDGDAQWPIDQLVPGGNESRELAVKVNDTLAEGSQVRALATATLGDGDGERVRATESTAVVISPLSVSLELTPDSVEPGKSLQVAATITNTSASTVNDIDAFVSIPQGLDAVRDADLSTGGSCPATVCTALERATWNVGALTAGQSTIVSFTATVANATAAGTLIPFVTEITVAGDAIAGASATASVCRGATCPAASQTLFFVAGRVSDSVTLGAGLPSETTITSTVDVDHGLNNGYSGWIAAYSAAGQVAWAATLSGGSAEGDGFARVTSADQDDAGNTYVTLQTNTFPGTLRLRSADNSTVEHTPTVDAGSRHYGVAKIDREGVWQWYAPIEAEAGSGGSAYIKPASTSVYNGRVYVTAEHGITDTGRTLRISDQTGVAFTPEGAIVHPVLMLDAATGTYIDHRVTNSATVGRETVFRHNTTIPIAPGVFEESFTVPTIGSVGPSGWYDGSSGYDSRAMDIVVNANDGPILLAGAVQAGVLVRRDLNGIADWAYLVNNGGGNTNVQALSAIGAALEVGDGVIFLGGVDGPGVSSFNDANGALPWPDPPSSSKIQYLARYSEAGEIRWLAHVNAGNAAGFGLTAGRPENRSVLYDPVADRVYAAYAMPPYPDMGIVTGQGTFFKDWNDPLLFGSGEATEETFAHIGDDGLIILAAFDGVDGSFLWATSHRRSDTQIFQPGSAGIFLNEDGEVVMLLVSRAGTTTYGDNKTPISIDYSTESMVAVRHSGADGSVLGAFTIEDLGSSSGSQTFFEGVFTKSQ